MHPDIKKEADKLSGLMKTSKFWDIIVLGPDSSEKESQRGIIAITKTRLSKKEADSASDYFAKYFGKGTSAELIESDDFIYSRYFIQAIERGFSVKKRKPFSRNLNLEPMFLVTYDLKPLGHSEKTLFGYALKGRVPGEGILGRAKGRTVGRNSFIVPYGHIGEIKDFLASWKVKFSAHKIFAANEKK